MILPLVYAFLMLFLALVAAIFQFCCDYCFNAHAVTIGSMFIYKLGVTSLREDRVYTVSTSLSESITVGSFLSFLNLID